MEGGALWTGGQEHDFDTGVKDTRPIGLVATCTQPVGAAAWCQTPCLRTTTRVFGHPTVRQAPEQLHHPQHEEHVGREGGDGGALDGRVGVERVNLRVKEGPGDGGGGRGRRVSEE